MQWYQFAILLLASPTLLEINLVGLTLPTARFAVITVPMSTIARCLFRTHRIHKSTPARSNIPSSQFASLLGSHSFHFFFHLCSRLHLEIILFFGWLITWSPASSNPYLHTAITHDWVACMIQTRIFATKELKRAFPHLLILLLVSCPRWNRCA